LEGVEMSRIGENMEECEELKPCPFCGWGTIVDGGIIKHYCECYACHAKGKPCKTWKEAIEAWNRRANDETD
jgi:hypothetical protein